MSDQVFPEIGNLPDSKAMESAEGSVDAEYALEMTAACPHCKKSIDSVHVVRALRTKVNFVSTLPRRGHLMVCPECRGILGGALAGLI